MSILVEKAEALAVEVSFSNDALSVTLSDGRVVSVPLVWARTHAHPRVQPQRGGLVATSAGRER